MWFISRSLCVLLNVESLIIYNEGRKFERFQFRVNVYQQQSFTSSTLLFQLDGGSCFSNIHFTLSGKAGSPDANGIIRSIRKEEALQSQTLVRIRTSSNQPKQGNPSRVEGFVRFSQCLPILRTHPQVPPRKTVSFYLFFYKNKKT